MIPQSEEQKETQQHLNLYLVLIMLLLPRENKHTMLRLEKSLRKGSMWWDVINWLEYVSSARSSRSADFVPKQWAVMASESAQQSPFFWAS